MIPTARYQRCCGITAKGTRCRNTGGCAIHRSANDERRRHDDTAHMAKIRKDHEKWEKASQPNLLSRAEIQELLEIGRRQAIAEEAGIGSLPCGCHG